MPFTPLTSAITGIVWALVCIGLATGPQLVSIARELRARRARRRS